MPEASFTDKIVFETPLVRIGAFRCDARYHGFQDTGPADNDCFVFPRTAVQIEHEHERPFAANANVVTFYNRSQRYLRHEISDQGDRCDWFGVNRDVARDVVRTFEPSVEDAPFRSSRGPCDARTYLMQRTLFNRVKDQAADPMAVEETVIRLLERVIAQSTRKRPPIAQKSNEIVHDAECILAANFDQPMSLSELAARVQTSVYHLCRTFRTATGMALHQYRRHLRLRHGLEQVSETSHALSRVAVDLGFAHHSHFTAAFRREFGCTPSDLRTPLLTMNKRPE